MRADLSLASCSMLGALIVLAGILVAEILGPPAAPESAEATAEKELKARKLKVENRKVKLVSLPLELYFTSAASYMVAWLAFVRRR